MSDVQCKLGEEYDTRTSASAVGGASSKIDSQGFHLAVLASNIQSYTTEFLSLGIMGLLSVTCPLGMSVASVYLSPDGLV